MRILRVVVAVISGVAGVFLLAAAGALPKLFGPITTLLYQLLAFYLVLGGIGILFERIWGFVLVLLACIFFSLLAGGVLVIPMAAICALTLLAAAVTPVPEEPAISIERLYQSIAQERKFVKKKRGWK
ncbi:MAG: hypothetical protein QW794_02290 [Thermosphaera sp.]